MREGKLVIGSSLPYDLNAFCPPCGQRQNMHNMTILSRSFCAKKGMVLSMDDKAEVSWKLSFGDGLIKKWPHDGQGQPEQPVFLTHCSSVNMEDRILINMLDAYGIPAVKYYPQNGCFGKVVLGISAEGADIYVPESVLEDAKALMEDGSND